MNSKEEVSASIKHYQEVADSATEALEKERGLTRDMYARLLKCRDLLEPFAEMHADIIRSLEKANE